MWVGEKMSDDNTIDLVVSEDFESWYDKDEEVVGITFLADGITKLINKEDFREFRDFISQTYDEFFRE